MNVSLTPELEALVDNKVQSGMYQTASEVVRAALRLLKERDEAQARRIEELRRDIAIGLSDLDDSRSKTFDRNALAEIKSKGRSRLIVGRGKKR